MIGIKANVKVTGLEAAMRRLSGLEKKKVYSDLRGPARFDQNHHDRYEEGPDGRWPSLHPSTVRRYARLAKAKRRRAKPRKLLGRLPRAVKAVVSNQSLIIRSRVPWSGVHQAGGRAGRGSRIPRRQFLWISDWLIEQAKKAFRKALLKAWNTR